MYTWLTVLTMLFLMNSHADKEKRGWGGTKARRFIELELHTGSEEAREVHRAREGRDALRLTQLQGWGRVGMLSVGVKRSGERFLTHFLFLMLGSRNFSPCPLEFTSTPPSRLPPVHPSLPLSFFHSPSRLRIFPLSPATHNSRVSANYFHVS